MVTISLAMTFDQKPDGTWAVTASWLDEPVEAASYQEAYWIALAARQGAEAAE